MDHFPSVTASDVPGPQGQLLGWPSLLCTLSQGSVALGGLRAGLEVACGDVWFHLSHGVWSGMQQCVEPQNSFSSIVPKQPQARDMLIILSLNRSRLSLEWFYKP